MPAGTPVLAAAYDLKAFFTVVAKPPRVRSGQPMCWRSSLPSALASPAGTAGHGVLQPPSSGAGSPPGCRPPRCACAVDRVGVLRVLAGPRRRRRPTRCRGGCRLSREPLPGPGQGVPLVRATRRLPRILSPAQVDALTAALRTHRDRAVVAAMVLGGLRLLRGPGAAAGRPALSRSGGCSSPRARRPAAADPRLGPVLRRGSRLPGGAWPAGTHASDRVFVVLKGPRRGLPLSAKGTGWRSSAAAAATGRAGPRDLP